ncbi:CoA transferase [Streptomyces sp. HC307]|uniref:CoA transferase n=1 Tax=Streptomyces flavusporus TaxID=3385496 RepID=UPI003917351C
MTRSLSLVESATGAQVAARSLGLVAEPADLDDLMDGSGAGPLECEISWAGPVDLPLSDERAVQAACGIMHVHGRAAGRPAPLAVDYASAAAGVLAAQGILAAWIARSRGVRVTSVRTSVSQAALLVLAQYLGAATADDDWREPTVPGSSTFVSADGVRFEFETLDPQRWLRFWTRLGADPAAAKRGWRPFQERFATATCPLPPELHETVRRTSFTTVRAAADGAGASVLPVREDPGPPAPARPWTLAPFPDQGSSGLPGQRKSAEAGPVSDRPLAGIRVIESTRRVQGPMAGHILWMLGADVVRIEPPGGDPMRGIPPIAGGCSARFSALNAGKSVTEADITTAEGRRTVHELVSGADVFLHNWAPGKAAQLRLDADDLRRTRPGLIYAWASGWGDSLGSSSPLGTDFLVQAHSGLAAALRPADEPPAPSLMTLTDVLGGLVCAQGVLAALLARIRTGHGGRVDSSLYSAATVLPRPARRAEWTALDRPLRTEDGYLALGREARERPEHLAAATGLGACAGITEITSQLRNLPTAFWSRRLAEAGLTATEVCADLRQLARDPRFSRALSVGEHVFPLAPWEFS